VAVAQEPPAAGCVLDQAASAQVEVAPAGTWGWSSRQVLMAAAEIGTPVAEGCAEEGSAALVAQMGASLKEAVDCTQVESGWEIPGNSTGCNSSRSR